MRVFHTLVFDDNLEGTATTLYSDPSHNAMLGLVEKLTLFAVSDTVSVTGTLAVQIEESGDQVRWTTKVANPELTQTLSTSADHSIGQPKNRSCAAVFAGRGCLNVTCSGLINVRFSWRKIRMYCATANSLATRCSSSPPLKTVRRQRATC